MKIRNDIAISDTGFVFDPVSGESYSLNTIAIEILKMFKEDKTEQEIKKILLEKYDINEIELERSLKDFEGMLQEYNFITSK